MRPQERPRLIRPLVRGVAPDVAPPYDAGAGLGQQRRHPRGLGVMEEHDVTRRTSPALAAFAVVTLA